MLKKRNIVWVLALAGLTASSSSAQVAPGNDASVLVPRAARNNVVVWVLHRPVDQVDFQDRTFEEVLDWVRDQGPINVVPQWRALEAEGVGPDALVTLQLRDTTVADVLNATIDLLSDAGTLRYRGSGNTLRISTEADFDRKLELKVYDITDILVRVRDFTGSPEIDIEEQSSSSGGGGGGGGSSQELFGGGGGGGGDDRDDDQDELNAGEDDPGVVKLRELIEDTIAPETWDTYGGKASVRPFNRSLVVRASIEVHEMIAGAFVR